jgi:hypothetical protein
LPASPAFGIDQQNVITLAPRVGRSIPCARPGNRVISGTTVAYGNAWRRPAASPEKEKKRHA